MLLTGLLVYLAAFAQGPGPTMGNRPVQAMFFTLATIMLIGGVLLLIV